MVSAPHWIAGPVSYKTTDNGVYPNRFMQVCKWEFIGGTTTGELRRWHLCFSTDTRKFTSTALSVNRWEKAHAKELADLYRPISVLRHRLPKGSIAVAMRSMLRPEDIAEALALSIGGGKILG